MIWFIVLLGLVLLSRLERIWLPKALAAIRIRQSCGVVLAEPGQKLCCTSTVENASRIPIPFIRLRLTLPEGVTISERKNWIRSHCQKGLQRWFVEERMALGGRKQVKRSVHFTAPARGVYNIGEYNVSAGDLMGFQEAHCLGDGVELVVMPDKPKHTKTATALGGFLGDISVRRFILEDPILTIGFRDYTGREPMKAISWKRSASAGSLQVKQFDHTAEVTVMVLLDVDDGRPEELEGCFRLMRMVCQELEKKKIPYGIRTNGNLPGPVSKLSWMAEGLGESHLGTILYALGRADYTRFHSFRYLTEQTLLHRKNNESYIVITPNLTSDKVPMIRKMESVVGNGLCVLSGAEEGRTA